MMFVWRIRGKVIRTVLCCVVYHSCTRLYEHTHISSSYRWSRVCWFRLRFCECFCVFLTRASFFVIYFVFFLSFYVLYLILVWLSLVNTSAIDCLKRPVHKMTYYVSIETLNSTHSLTHSLTVVRLFVDWILYFFECQLAFFGHTSYIDL